MLRVVGGTAVNTMKLSGSSNSSVHLLHPKMEATIVRTYNALLPLLPPPLKLLQGSLLITIEEWSDGNVVADLPCAGIASDGCINDILAIEDLSFNILEQIEECLEHRKDHPEAQYANQNQWDMLCALIDITKV
jgi:hypothetical protein